MYSDRITDRERQLGYTVAKMPNPRGIYLFRRKCANAVVYQLDEDNVIVKIALPAPVYGFRYSHQQRYDSHWLPVQNVEFDPETAIRNASAFVEQQREAARTVRA